MEKFQMLFPYSSTIGLSSSSSTYQVSSNMSNSHVLSSFEGGNNNNNSSSNSYGFLGLKLENHEHGHHLPSAPIRSEVVGKDADDLISQQSNNNASFSLIGPESTAEVKASCKKKVSEKKIRKPRYAFQTRSQVDILDDGYRWRKYGQKAVKNNKFPRSYYRCTHQGCNVKKQVQRLTKDEGVVVTTYEGMHTHPIEKQTDNFEHILSQMQIYTPF